MVILTQGRRKARRRRALVTTDTEERAMTAEVSLGESSP